MHKMQKTKQHDQNSISISLNHEPDAVVRNNAKVNSKASSNSNTNVTNHRSNKQSQQKTTIKCNREYRKIENTTDSEINLIEQEIRIELVRSKVVATTRTIAFILQVSNYTHVAEAVTASSKEGVFDELHAYRTTEVLVEQLARCGDGSVGVRGGCGGVATAGVERCGIGGRPEVGFDGRDVRSGGE